MTSIKAHFKSTNVYTEGTNFHNNDLPTVAIKITTPNFQKKIEKTFIFVLDETIWEAKQKVLVEFANLEFIDPLNFGFYLPPHSGRAGKFLDEFRLLQDYPMAVSDGQLEFRYKRRIFRHLHPQDEKRLLKINTKKHQKKFMELITTRNYTEMERMLEKGLDPNFHDEKTGETPLIVASMMDDCIAILKLLVMFGAYLDFRSQSGLTAMHEVAMIGKLDSMKGLLDLGASPNYRDASGLTPLYYSIISGSSPNITQSLLYERAEVGVTDLHGFEEIHQACKHGHSQHLEHLIYYGANINSRTSSGSTPLHICALENQESCARVLCFRGADRTSRNYSQQTAYEVAIVANNFEVAAVINEFKESDIKIFSEKPVYSKRRSRNSSRNSSKSDISSEALTALSSNSQPATLSSSDVMHTQSNLEGMHKFERNTASNNSTIPSEMIPDYSESESDSEDDNGLKPMSSRRTFSNGGVGTQRSPAPIKIKQTVPLTLRKRLYASVPGRHYVAIIDYEPTQAGEIKLEKGEFVDVLFVGEQGFWEGKVGNHVGWFPSYCVQETLRPMSVAEKKRSWFGSKKSPLDIVDKVSKLEPPKEREVTLKRGDKGFGFQMRGANSHVQHIEFNPSPQFPALQYIGEVDKGGVADKAGLKAGDFVLAINGEEVISATHSYAVSLINKGGKTLTIKVITIGPESVDPELILPNGSLRSKDVADLKESLKAAGIVNDSDKKKPPIPPNRSMSTSLSQFSNEDNESFILSEAAIALESETVVLEKSNIRKASMKGMWAGNAIKLKGEELKIRDENISRGISRKQKALTCDFATDFDQKFKLITRQMKVDSDSNVKSSPSLVSSVVEERSEILANHENKKTPKITPPDYDDAINNIRKGRANSLSKSENRPRSYVDSTSETTSTKRNDFPAISSSRNSLQNEIAFSNYNKQYSSSADQMNKLQLSQPRFDEDEQVTTLRRHIQSTNNPQLISDGMQLEIADNYDFRSTSVNVSPQENRNQQKNEEQHVTAQTVLSAHQNMLYRIDNFTQIPSPDGLRQTQSVYEDNVSRQTPQVDGLVRLQHLRQQQMKMPPAPTAIPPPPPTAIPSPPPAVIPPLPPPLSELSKLGNCIPPPPQLASSNSSLFGKTPPTSSFENSIANAAAARTLKLKNNLTKNSDSFENHTVGYNNSNSSAILDSANSQGTGCENLSDNHSSALSQAIAARAAKLAKETVSATSLPEVKNLEENFLLKPSELLKKKTFHEKAEKDFTCTDTKMQKNPPATLSKPSAIKVKKNESSPPSTKPKPRKDLAENNATNASDVNSNAAIASDMNNINSPATSDVNNINSAVTSDVNNNKYQNVLLSEHMATSYLDGVIADAEASLLYDLISSNRAASYSTTTEKLKDLEPFPQMDIIHHTENNNLPDDFLPPPPSDLLSDVVENIIVNHEQPSLSDKNDATSSVNILPSSIAEKHFSAWSVKEVGDWLEFLNLGQYKNTFLENDIKGYHLSDLTKDELRELGVEKLGHRKTIDDAIKKLVTDNS